MLIVYFLQLGYKPCAEEEQQVWRGDNNLRGAGCLSVYHMYGHDFPFYKMPTNANCKPIFWL